MNTIINSIYNKIYEKKYPILIILFSILVISLWFYDGKQFAQAEEGLSLFTKLNPIESHWLWRDLGTGYPTPLFINRIPQAITVFILLKLSLPMWFIQAIFFFLILLTGLFGVWSLSKFILKEYPYITDYLKFLITLSYFLNLYSISQIWGRFLYSGYFTWGIFPWIIFLQIKFFNERKVRYLGYMIILNILGSHAYSHPGYVFAILSPQIILIILTILDKIIQKKYKELKSITKYTFVWLTTWILSTIWWLYPYIQMGDKIAATRNITKDANYFSLVGVSQYYPISNLAVLRAKNLFGSETYNGWFDHFLVKISIYLIFVLVLLGTITSFKKSKSIIFMYILLICGFFISKGTNQPFGEIFYKFMFDNFTFFQALRSPFEKFGIVFVLPYVVFWGLGVGFVVSKLKSYSSKIVVQFAILFLVFIVIGKPIWTSEVFGAGILNTKITIPIEYNTINSIINSFKTDKRILLTPMLAGDSLTLNWPEGNYRGVAPSNEIFTNPVISKIIRTPYYDEKYWKLYYSLKNKDKENFLSNINDMHIGFIINRYDIENLSETEFVTPAEVTNFLNTVNELKLIKKERTLELFLVNDSKNDGKISLSKCNGEISYKYIGLARYKIKVKNANSACNIIFKETYSQYWKAFIDNFELKNHEIALGYANSWKIEKTGDYDITIEFKL